MRVFATVAAGILGVALATWGVVQLLPRDVQAASLDDAPARTDSVRSVRFRGDVDWIGVRRQLRTQVGAPIDDAIVASDRALIESSLVGEGHLDARVAVTGGPDVVFSVDAGPIYRLGSVTLIGALVTRYPLLAGELTVSAGEELSTSALDRTQERLATWLVVHGVAQSLITHQLAVDHAAKRVDVTYDVEVRPVLSRR